MISAFAALALAGVVLAAPAPIERSTTVSVVSAATISTYAPFTRLASAAYCSAAATWTCAACAYVPGVVPYATGGDGDAVPKWYVAWWPAQSTVVVGHQGTDPTQFESLLTDAEIAKDPLSTTLFPGVSSSVQAHAGFLKAHAASAPAILTAVKKALSDHAGTKVAAVGHSLGGAIATLDALYFKLNLPSTVAVKAVTYGLPRVGNQDFANLIDSKITDFTHITNEKDLVPIIPGRGLGFVHPSNEKHIVSAGQWYACAGQDNTSVDCSTGAVSNIFVGNTDDHLGPYEGIYIGSDYC
ncbi:alpha/beta-hydrolase [Ceratobasidium sp. AG-I]|nr:alpha/beta-hydrolase [Ceratobasidium sp. AG-I]